MQKIELYQKRDMGQVIAVSALLFRRHWRHMFRTIGLMTLPLFLMTSTLYFLSASATNPDIDTGVIQSLDALTLNSLFMILSAYIAFTVLTWGCVYYVQLYEEKGPENFEMTDIWNRVFSHGWKLLLAYLVYYILLIIGSVLLGLAMVTILLSPLAVLGFLFINTFFLFLPVVFLQEKEGVFTAMDRSFKLLRKNWLKAVGIFICTLAVIGGFVLMPIFLWLMLYQVLNGYGFSIEGTITSGWAYIIVQNVALLFSFIALFFLMSSYTALYYSLVESRDKYSLKRRIEQLSQKSETGTYL